MRTPTPPSPTTTTASAPDSGVGRARERALAVALVVVALAPVLAVVVTRTGRDYLPVQDLAVIDLRVRDVFTLDTPLVGPYSRYGWNHPGPVMYWVPALLGAPFGHPAWATLVGGALTSGIAIAWIGALAWRLGRLLLVAVVLGALALCYSALGDWMFLEAWNPHLAFPFFALFLLQVWAIGEGRLVTIVGAAVTASLLVQTHVGYFPFVVTGAGYALACLLAARDSIDQRAALRMVWVSVGVAVVLWLPPILEQLLRAPGNGEAIASFFLGDGGPPALGTGEALRLFAAEFRPPIPWLGGGDPVDPTFGWAAGAGLGWLVVPALLLGSASFVAWRTRDPRSVRVVALAVVMSVTGIASIARVTDLPDRYLFLWRVQLAVLLVVASVAVLLWALPAPGRRRAAAAATALGSVSVVVVFGALTVDVVRHDDAVMAAEPDVAALLEQLPEPDGPVIVRVVGDPFLGIQGGVFDELDRRGAPVFVDEEYEYQFGSHRGLVPGDADEIWYVVEQGAYASYLATLPGAEVLAVLEPLPPAAAARLAELEVEVAEALLAAGRGELLRALDDPLVAFLLEDVSGLDPAAVDELAALTEQTAGMCRCAVIAFPADQAPELLP